MRRIVIVLGLWVAAFLPLSGQSPDWNHYTPLVAQAPIPDDILVLASQQYEASRIERGLDTIANARERATREEFLLQSTFVIRELLQSGKVLFNDPLSVYCNEMKDFLLRDNEAVRSKIRIYVVKSPAVNAFATSDGILFVNVGLLAHLTNEAQLAFVLCHEIQHYIKQHPINERVENERMANDRALVRGSTLEDRLLAKNQYSRELETEADELGLELYLTTPYSLAALDEAFDILQYAHLPFSNMTFDKDFFQTSNLVWPETYWLDSVTPISPRDEFDEVRSTHPSIKDRRANIHSRAEAAERREGEAFVVKDENEFAQILKLARFEMTWWLLDLRHYEEAIYSAYALLQQEPENFFLKKVIAHALYGLSCYCNGGRYARVHQDFVEMEGSSQQVYHLLEKMNCASLNTLAIIWAWRVHELAPEDEEVNLMIDHLIRDMRQYHDEVAKAMVKEQRPVEAGIVEQRDTAAVVVVKKTPPEVKRRAEIAEMGEDRAVAVKPGSIIGETENGILEEKKEKIIKTPSGNNTHLKYALAMELNIDSFFLQWDNIMNSWDEDPQVVAPSKRKKPGYEFSQVKGKLLVYEPFYEFSMINVNSTGVASGYFKTEKGKLEYSKMIEDLLALAKIDFEMIDRQRFQAIDQMRFNWYVLISNWIAEFFADPELNLVNLYQDEFAKQFGGGNFDWIMLSGLFHSNLIPKETHIVCFVPTSSTASPVLFKKHFYYLRRTKTATKFYLYSRFRNMGRDS